MFCIVRLGVGLVSLVVPLMISHVGFPIAGSIMIAFLIISTLVGAIMIPDTRGKSLHSIEQERYGQ
jgi:inositol transporter-like SP family MFS transporter